jgi:hypothetical protein
MLFNSLWYEITLRNKLIRSTLNKSGNNMEPDDAHFKTGVNTDDGSTIASKLSEHKTFCSPVEAK